MRKRAFPSRPVARSAMRNQVGVGSERPGSAGPHSASRTPSGPNPREPINQLSAYALTAHRPTQRLRVANEARTRFLEARSTSSGRQGEGHVVPFATTRIGYSRSERGRRTEHLAVSTSPRHSHPERLPLSVVGWGLAPYGPRCAHPPPRNAQTCQTRTIHTQCHVTGVKAQGARPARSSDRARSRGEAIGSGPLASACSLLRSPHTSCDGSRRRSSFQTPQVHRPSDPGRGP